MELLNRLDYLQKLIRTIKTPDIKVITGIRRSGKSKLLEIFIEYIKKEIPNANVIHINYNLFQFSTLKNASALNEYVENLYQPEKENFLLIDEVQLCNEFEQAINSFHASEKYHIYITGSNAFLLSSDLATLFTGRTYSIEVFPFSFAEFCQYFEFTDIQEAFELYTMQGGMSGSYLYEEPEECDALFDYLCDFYCEVIEKTIDLYKPDIMGITDDTAAWGNPFVSLEMMQHYFVPRYKRMADYAHDRDIPVTLHNCGKCEIFMDDMVNVVGVNGWNPAQDCNDLVAIKKKFGNKLVLTGCINSSQTFEDPNITEDQIREICWDVANKYAPGGGFAFQCHFIIPDPTDQHAIWKRDTVNKYIAECAETFYQK